ncbi:MAG: 6-bladed beta-propeller [Bacteroidota bacterium]
MKTYLFSFLLAVSSMIGCKNILNNSNSMLPYYIDLEKDIDRIKSIPLSTFGSKLEYIPLETGSDFLIKSVDNIFINDSFIFIGDYNQRLLLFDINGKYLRQIGKIGKGPGEYQSVENFVVGNKQKEIYILSYREVNIFDFTGQFKRDFRLDFPCSEIIMDDNGDLILHPFSSAQPTTDPVYSWYVYDNKGTEKTKILNTSKRINGGITVPYSPLYMFNGTPHFMEFGIDTLYNYSDNLKLPYAIFNYGKMKYPVDPTLSESLSIDDKIWVSKIQEIKDLLLVNVWWGRDSILNCVFSKSSSDFAVINETGFTNDIDSGMNFWPRKIINDNLMIDFKDAFELIAFSNNYQINSKEQSNRIKEIINHLSETSNPVIIILRN